MPVKDLHSKAFDNSTFFKLDLFKEYFESWLPVFIYSNYYNEISIYDFFAGTGKDTNGQSGSPLLILEILKKYESHILAKSQKINLFFNEYNKSKFIKLRVNIESYLNTLDKVKSQIHVNLYNKDFKALFKELYPQFGICPNYMIFDQNGVKQITKDIFQEICNVSKTDFIFYISSSYFKRFSNQFKLLFPDLDISLVKKTHISNIHRIILDMYKKMLPSNSQVKLYPFSIKKNNNFFGVIFGAAHPLAIDKFLKIAWNKNNINGEANFDIDNDLEAIQCLPGFEQKTKIDDFKDQLRDYILSLDTITNKQIYDFTIESGHIPEHCKSILNKLKRDKKINFSRSAKVNYENCYKNKNIIILRNNK